MPTKAEQLYQNIQTRSHDMGAKVTFANQEVTVTVAREKSLQCLQMLRDDPFFQFNQLIDVCGVDYQQYGLGEWDEETVTTTGFSRGVAPTVADTEMKSTENPRFAVVYHLLSLTLNHRVRVRVYCEESDPVVDSVIDIWPCANWFEREAYDLYGILFKGHPDLRRILTDYGFIGYPFRKDFPLSGYVEMRYDATLGRVVYEPVNIVPRVTVPKVIRHDSRYLNEKQKEQ